MNTIHDKLWYVKKDGDKLAYMTHYESNKAFEKRKATGLGWASYRNPSSTTTEEIIDNIPLAGFKVVGSSERYSTSNKFIRIEDPRGFICEVPISGFVNILSQCSVVNGEIQEKCVWSRHNGEHNLIVEGSKDHKKFLETQTKLDKKVSMRNVPVGAMVTIMEHGREKDYYYLGKSQLEATMEIYEMKGRTGYLFRQSTKNVIDTKKFSEKNPKHTFISADFMKNMMKDKTDLARYLNRIASPKVVDLKERSIDRNQLDNIRLKNVESWRFGTTISAIERNAKKSLDLDSNTNVGRTGDVTVHWL